jgi:hypothetical protein
MTTGYGSSAASGGEVRGRSNGLAVAGLVCGIVGLFVLNIILGPLALVLSGVGLRNAHRGASGRGMAIAGLVLGALDLVVFVLLIAVAASNGGFHWYVGS